MRPQLKVMLRAKQLGTISQCARSFYLNSSRSGGLDGASCSCSEDEKDISRRQSNSTGFRLKKKNPGVASEPVAKAVGSVWHYNYERTDAAASEPHVICPTSPVKSDSSTLNGKVKLVNDCDRASQKGLVHLTTECSAKAGIPTVGIFSKPKTTTKDGQGIVTKHKCMVDTSQSSNIDSTKSNSRNRLKHSKPRAEPSDIIGGSNSHPRADNGPGNKAVKAGSLKVKQSIPATSGVAQRSTSSAQGQSQCLPHKPKVNYGSAITETKSGGRKDVAAVSPNVSFANKVQHPINSTRLQARRAPYIGRSINNIRAIELHYHTLQQLQWGPAAEEALDNISFKLNAFQANQVLKLLRDQTVAFGFFKWLKRQAGFKHDDYTYTTMIGILGHARQFGPMKRLLEEMISDGCQPTVVTFNRMIHAYGRANYIGDAVNVFHQMQEAGYEPDQVTYCTLIDIHAKSGYLEVALDLYRRMQEVGLSPDTFTYSAMVNCLGKGGRLDAAYKLFCEMIGKGHVPNLVTYNIMISLQAKARNYPSTVKLYRDMQAAGFRPDKITYSIVMEVLGHFKRLDEVESVFMEMKQNWVPDEPVYGLLVDLWGKSGNVDKARAWYQTMLKAGLRPNVPTCNSLLSAFLKVHRLSDAHDVLLNMLALGLVPSLQTYTLLLSYCTETRSQMRMCCQLMAISGHPAHLFLVSLPDAEPGGQNVRDHASSFLDLMHSEDRESKRGIVDAIIDFLHKAGLKEEAGWIWEVAAQRNVYPDSVREKQFSYWLINLHVMSEGTAVTALSRTLAWFQTQMLASGMCPRRIDIVTGWGKRSRVTGSSLVRQSVQEMLKIFRFPFFTQHGNSGCFVGRGESLNKWLLNSYVGHMHLL